MTQTKKLRSIYDIKFNDSEAFYWYDANCQKVSNAEFRAKFPLSDLKDYELDFFRNEIISCGVL